MHPNPARAADACRRRSRPPCAGPTACSGGPSRSCRPGREPGARSRTRRPPRPAGPRGPARSEEHTSELQSLMRTSYAVFFLKKKKTNNNIIKTNNRQISNKKYKKDQSKIKKHTTANKKTQ